MSCNPSGGTNTSTSTQRQSVPFIAVFYFPIFAYSLSLSLSLSAYVFFAGRSIPQLDIASEEDDQGGGKRN